MKPWTAALLAFIIVGLVVSAFQPAAGGLAGLVAAFVVYVWARSRYEAPERF